MDLTSTLQTICLYAWYEFSWIPVRKKEWLLNYQEHRKSIWGHFGTIFTSDWFFSWIEVKIPIINPLGNQKPDRYLDLTTLLHCHRHRQIISHWLVRGRNAVCRSRGDLFLTKACSFSLSNQWLCWQLSDLDLTCAFKVKAVYISALLFDLIGRINHFRKYFQSFQARSWSWPYKARIGHHLTRLYTLVTYFCTWCAYPMYPGYQTRVYNLVIWWPIRTFSIK